MDDNLVLLTITDVRVAVPAGNGVEAGLVVLEESVEPHRRLQVYVGQPEARAIQVSWSHQVPPRPSTWDLFVSTISLLDARIDRVVISDVQEERHFFAQLVVHRAEVDDPLLLTARPSDAMALALRAHGAEIYAQSHVLDSAGLLADGSHWVRPAPEPEEPSPYRVGRWADRSGSGDDDDSPEEGDAPEADDSPEAADGSEAADAAESPRVEEGAADRAAAARAARSFRGP